jgi:hypothetical protein
MKKKKKSRISNRSSTPLLNISPVLLYSYEKHFLKESDQIATQHELQLMMMTDYLFINYFPFLFFLE